MLMAALGGCRPPSAPVAAIEQSPPVHAAAVDAARLAKLDPDQWLTAGRDANGTYYSPVDDLNAANVAKLGFAWDYHLGTNRGLEATPLVIDGVMYATGNFGRVYALDAATGRELWTCTTRASTDSGRVTPVATL
jgi:quinohemoprotein ethanol dehydrogenase